MPKLKIKKGDQVEVIAGKDRGRRGKVLRVDPVKGRVVVEGVNFIKRHTRPNPSKNIQGGIVEREASMHVSNVMVVSPESGARTRVRSKVLDDGRRVREAKVDGAILDR
ncbi:MAG: 50S ribosomal protein L24 [Acidobacteria bacterium]|jgi:large subunit ribosomal protein L24|nr:50S ribosomal protein L24 [Acidobacteriota bacterium]